MNVDRRGSSFCSRARREGGSFVDLKRKDSLTATFSCHGRRIVYLSHKNIVGKTVKYQ